ncbi:MAG: hypothetical protein A3F73_06095 [Gallionellales bacterium RIFCSPLOWO2_12_FULL_59_22]|nr:MAG: hypothetical protein A3H99_03255 [Gallionellales bacterium RIFCSPLOWO2_02_FULL_59_110]OGT03672.1 MAG: hypothetical protein A2Z65_02420 [Gallionellales bacterium RIFCSPLOWO2_02_58_13]OGT11014.1 MAG: hypothetical protein A3F73_06095 [Gallionellales bacterium RIFCSPLOWO2_12_FULL_59_22]
MKQTLTILLMIASSMAFADSDTPDKLNELESTLNRVRQGQQSVYQNYLMTKELRLLEIQEGSLATSQHPYSTSINTPPPNYDDIVRAQLEREQRIQQYTNDLKNMSMRYLELEEQRKKLLEQIGGLAQQPSK